MITDKFEELFRVLHEASLAPPRGPLARVLRSLPAVSTLPAPWVIWAMLGLLDLWRAESLGVGAARGGHLTPARPRSPGRSPLKGLKASGVLSGLTEWSFELDGVTGVVADRTTGERLELRIDAGPRVFLRSELSEHLQARREHGPAGHRLLRSLSGVPGTPAGL